MSADKRKSEARQLVILRRAMPEKGKREPEGYGGLLIHGEGGMALDNPDLQKLVKRGLMKVVRPGGVPKWSREFRAIQRLWTTHHSARIRRTRAIITRAGMNFLARHGG